MKKVVTTPAVDIALRTLDLEESRRVQGLFLHFRNWDDDPFMREHSQALPEMPGVHVFRTSTDLWIFFRIEGDTITVLDIARRQAILTTNAR